MNKSRLNRALSRLDSRTLPALQIKAINAGMGKGHVTFVDEAGDFTPTMVKRVMAYNDQK